MMEKSKKPRSRKRTLFVIILLITISVVSVFIIKNIKLNKNSIQEPSDDQLLGIALKHPQVQAFLAEKQYTTDVRTVSKSDIDEMPVLFSGLSGELYLIDFKGTDSGLRVVLDDKEVKKVFPITYMSIT